MQPGVPPSYMAYDRTIVVFSPDGRLLQVEYARQAVKKGSTSAAVKTDNVVVLGAVKTTSKLGVDDIHKKLYEIDEHVGIASSGLLADARDLVEFSRVRAQINRITYGSPISISTLAKHIADRTHVVTQYAGVRPFGVGLLIGGVEDTGSKLFETDPSGTLIEWKAQSIGRGSDKAKKVLETDYKDNLKEEDAVKLVIKAIKSGEKEINSSNVEVAVVKKSGFKRLSDQEVAKYL